VAQSFKTFIDLFKKSQNKVWEHRKIYFPVFLVLFILNNTEFINKVLGLSNRDNSNVWMTIVVGVLNFIVITKIVLWQKKTCTPDDKLIYILPAYLLYNLYYSLLFFVGFALLIIPGFYALIYFFMAPLIAVLDDTNQGEYFKRSRELTKKDFWLVTIISILILLLEIFSYFSEGMGSIAPFLSLFDAYLSIVLTILSVEIYYYLMAKN
jgi:hypothetical protein